MKALVISTMIILAALFILIPASVQSAEETASEEQQIENPENREMPSMTATDDPNVEETIDANSPNDQNTVSINIEIPKDLEAKLRQIDSEGKDEVRLWTRRTEDKLELVLAVQQQNTAELNLLRELAVEEGDLKTAVAIDRILADRKERYKGIIERFEREKERLRREEERERDREERDRGRSRERPSRNR